MDDTTRATTKGRFARVCVEIDMGRHLKATYRMRGRNWRIQYEGLHDLLFECRTYDHIEVACPIKTAADNKGKGTEKEAQLEERACH